MKENNLEQLIKKFGEPDALIDNFSLKEDGYAIWGYEDIFKYTLNDYKNI